ncbi:MAG: hypothetical protein AB8F95_09530 [Bacteroidia bacterium]
MDNNQISKAELLKIYLIQNIMYLVEILLMLCILCVVFALDYPKGDPLAKAPIILNNLLLWVVILRYIFGYTFLSFLALFALKLSKWKFSAFNIAWIDTACYILLSLLFAFVLIPETRDYLTFEFHYNQGYFYISIALKLIIPFLVKQLPIPWLWS